MTSLSSSPTGRLETDVVVGRALRVSFCWRDDRYEHVVEALSGCEWVPIMSSVEGGAESSWPASPPFQQLTIESRDDGDVALLVGMAGKSHWSASVECERSSQRLSFDIACLAKTTPQRLVSTYRDCGGGWHPVSAEPRSATSPLGVRLSAVGEADLTVSSTTLAFSADASGSLGQTYRWKYDIDLVEVAREPR